MQKFYYFSKTKQKLIQIEYLNKKSILIYILIVSFLCGTTWLTSLLVDHFNTSSKSFASLENENLFLRKQLKNLYNKYHDFDIELAKLRDENNSLRIAANLPPIQNEEFSLGIGGKEFEIKSSLHSADLDNLTNLVEKLSLKLKFEKNQHEIISEKLKNNKLLYKSIPALKPCSGEIGERGFGMREHPILGINRMHEGIDIITDTGTKVYAPGSGVISSVGFRGGYGLTVEVEHAAGYKTIYAHLSKILVSEGQEISRGKLIALTGNSGLSTGPHLHYEVHHEGIKLDPTQFFFDDLVLFEKNDKN
ncbi:MAG: M23 family metallopeptidase [Ignavibacteriaceae bacterium]|nr:M23 family metallopeptidase [Ignavibacteriaceae bacterium]